MGSFCWKQAATVDNLCRKTCCFHSHPVYHLANWLLFQHTEEETLKPDQLGLFISKYHACDYHRCMVSGLSHFPHILSSVLRTVTKINYPLGVDRCITLCIEWMHTEVLERKVSWGTLKGGVHMG